jgi:hypothetical protein
MRIQYPTELNFRSVSPSGRTRHPHRWAAPSLGKIIYASLLIAMVLASCSTGGQTQAVATDVTCTAEGCPCIFGLDCPDGMQCVNGLCSTDDPFPDFSPHPQADAESDLDLEETDEDSGSNEIMVTNLPFGAPCSTGLQCASDWCIDAADGGYCTHLCTDGCPDGWTCKSIVQTAPDYIEVCVLDDARLCLPCDTDLHCGTTGDLCLDIGGGHFCGRDCTDEECPSGYICNEVTIDGIGFKQCRPENNACDCDDSNIGEVRSCLITNEVGTCFGDESCDAKMGWIACTAPVPEEESCDGFDNNCNGQIDEGFEKQACTVTTEAGSCEGVESCQGVAGWMCSAITPTPEVCNGLDDNCNGSIDEDFVDDNGLYLTADNCGTCGNSCQAKYEGAAEVDCQMVGSNPKCIIVACEPGYYLFNELSCLDEDSFLCQPCKTDNDCYGESSRCVGVSVTDPRTFCARDCSGDGQFSPTCPTGYACEDYDQDKLCMPENDSCDCTEANSGQSKACSQQGEAGICFGTEICDPAAGWVDCTAAIPEPEVCDGIDNDCDGILDEETVQPTECISDNEFGSCTGSLYCGGIDGPLCSALIPEGDICDGIDNNCDGFVDEDFAFSIGDPPVLKYAMSAANCGACGYQCPAIPNGSVECNSEPAVPACIVQDCDDGYFNYQDQTCLPLPETNLCKPCSDDQQCEGPSDMCIPDGPDSGSCGRDCAVDSIYSTEVNPCSGETGVQGCCPTGFLCEGAGQDRQCLPLSGACSCVEDKKVEACYNKNQHGTCYGLQTCELTGTSPGWSECTAGVPEAEICDGADNDCDGLLDDLDDSLDYSSSPSGNADCSNGIACNGSWTCSLNEWFCDAPLSLEETCDGLDNDCDAEIDEGFLQNGLYLHPLHCGACGLDCAQVLPNAIDPECTVMGASPTCTAVECAPGFFPYAGGIACMALPDNLCQPCASDSDCLVPSSLCVTLGIEKVCSRSCAVDGPYGPNCPEGYSCSNTGNGDFQCLPLSGSCICGVDTVGLTRSCSVDECVGQQTCENNNGAFAFTACDAEGVIPEVCDGIDNDCDGTPDEGFLNDQGIYGTDENCGVCGNNCLVQVSPVVHHALGGCDTNLAVPECAVMECTTEDVGGQQFEWVDVNEILDDGCECRRVQDNTDNDPPDLEFIPEGENLPAFPATDALYIDANCDGIDGVIGDALFVSAANPQAGDGSRLSPFKTINAALNALPASGKDYILVAGGTYEESIELYSGAVLHGGYSTDFMTRNIALFATEIRGAEPDFGSPAPLHGTVNAIGISGATTILSGFVVVGYDIASIPAAGQGYNSYGIYVLDSTQDLTLVNNIVGGGFAGAGADGSSGTSGYGAQSNGGNTLTGLNGNNAGGCNTNCNNQSSTGGSGGSNSQCAQANGPVGGAVVCPAYNLPAYTPPDPGHDGSPGWSWTLDSGSSYSCGSHATEAGYPTDIKKMDGGDGNDGNAGNDGLQGTGCVSDSGYFENGHWTGSNGQNGVSGLYGQAGGRGGASGGVDSASKNEMPPGVNPYNGNRYKLGATGGGGGAGGCGGTGGLTGGTGGASIAVFVAWSTPGVTDSAPDIQANLLERGYGGPGGTGGYGGSGGLGGNGGLGGDSSNYWIDFRAGKGGRGGRGGEGGGGGGGCGGASYGVSSLNFPANWDLTFGDDNDYLLEEGASTGGAGGSAGPSGQDNPAGDGASGASLNAVSVPN